MTRLYLALDDALAVIGQGHDGWQAELALVDKGCQCVTVDPGRPRRVYCGTFASGLWLSDDGGRTWQPAGAGIGHERVMAVSVGTPVAPGELGLVWAGTEPSALFLSEDGGQTWQEQKGLQELPSRSTWRFPPRPWTHHVRWIEPDPHAADRLFVGIELGGVMRSLDGGLTWEDRKPGSQHDCHTLRTHPLAPGRVYEAAGGGFAESFDGGDTWHGFDQGMDHHYVWGLAVDSGDPDTQVVSAAHGARQAHDNQRAESTIYRRTGGRAWVQVRTGLPEPTGTRIYVLASHRGEPGVFFAATGSDLYRSSDAGLTWERVPVRWPQGYGSRDANALTVADVQ
jgi:hypothetical protein